MNKFSWNVFCKNFVMKEGFSYFQKQPPEVFYEKRCSYKFHKIYRKTPVPKSLFAKDSGTGVSCEFCEISKNAFFTEHLWETSPVCLSFCYDIIFV